MISSASTKSDPAARAPPLPSDAMAAGVIVMTEFLNMNSGVRGTTLPVPTRPRDIKAADSLLAKLRVVSSGRSSSTVFGHAFHAALGERGEAAGGMCYRVEFAPPAPTGSGSTPPFDAEVAETVWFVGCYEPLVVFCASKSDAGKSREYDEIDDCSPVLMWTGNSCSRVQRALARLWLCCEGGAGLSVPCDGDAFDDLGSDYEEHLFSALDTVPCEECEAIVAGIRAAYCAAHGLPTAPTGSGSASSASCSGTGETIR